MSSGQQILEQDEIDALLDGVGSGAVDTTEATGEPASVQAYDLGTQVRIVRGRMPTLEMINDRFARRLRVALYNLMHRTVDITASPVKISKFSEFMQSLPAPAHLNLVRMSPLRGTGLVVFDARLVFALVDTFFGGAGRQTKIDGREFTLTETRIIQLVLRQAFVEMQEAWSPVLPLQIEYLSSEMNPLFANIATPSEIVVSTAFRVALEGAGGDLYVTLPYSMIEPIRDLLDSCLQSDRAERDGRWSTRLRAEVENVDVELRPVLGRMTVTVEQLLNARPGDVLACDFDGNVTLLAEGVPLLRGAYCNSRGQQAVQVNERLDPAKAAIS